MTAPAPVLAAALAARAGIPATLLPSVSERAARTVAAVQAIAYRTGGRVRLTQREIAERVVWEALLDWWDGRLERVCGAGAGCA